MNNKRLSIAQVRKLVKMTARTLHHYDQIGLVVSQKSENGYRTYDIQDVVKLQAISMLKYLGFGLKDIKQFMTEYKTHAELFDKQIDLIAEKIASLEKSRELLKDLRSKIDTTEGNFNESYSELIKSYCINVLPENLKKSHGVSAEDVAKIKQRNKESLDFMERNQEFFKHINDEAAILVDNHEPIDGPKAQELAGRFMEHFPAHTMNAFATMHDEGFKKISEIGVIFSRQQKASRFLLDAARIYALNKKL